MYLETSIGLSVKWNDEGDVFVSIDRDTELDNVRGICGTFNDNNKGTRFVLVLYHYSHADDFTEANGANNNDITAFMQSFQTNIDSCAEGEHLSGCAVRYTLLFASLIALG